MKVKLSAGAELDLITKDEVRDILKDERRNWQIERGIGPKHVLWYGTGVVTAAGGLTIGGAEADPSSGRYGPDSAFVWAVKRWNIKGLTGADSLSAYINNESAIRSIRETSAYASFGNDELVLLGGDKLLLVGTGLTTAAGTTVTVAGSAWELPRTMLYRLM